MREIVIDTVLDNLTVTLYCLYVEVKKNTSLTCGRGVQSFVIVTHGVCHTALDVLMYW